MEINDAVKVAETYINMHPDIDNGDYFNSALRTLIEVGKAMSEASSVLPEKKNETEPYMPDREWNKGYNQCLDEVKPVFLKIILERDEVKFSHKAEYNRAEGNQAKIKSLEQDKYELTQVKEIKDALVKLKEVKIAELEAELEKKNNQFIEGNEKIMQLEAEINKYHKGKINITEHGIL